MADGNAVAREEPVEQLAANARIASPRELLYGERPSLVEPTTLPAATRESVEQILRMHDFLSAELEMSEACLQGVKRQFPELLRMRTIPGIGRILAPVLWSEIGDLNRFASASALVNYTGLVPSLYESGEVSIHGGITRQGPVWLRWALVVAANAAIRGRNTFARRYRRLRRRKPANVAKTAVARRWPAASMEF